MLRIPHTNISRTWSEQTQERLQRAYQQTRQFLNSITQVVVTPRHHREAMNIYMRSHTDGRHHYLNSLFSEQYIDCRDVPSGSIIHVNMPHGVRHVTFNTQDHVKVQLASNCQQTDVYPPVHVFTVSGDHHAMRGIAHFANDNSVSHNGITTYGLPNSYTYGKHQVTLLRPHVVACAELAMASIILQHYRGAMTRREHFLACIQDKTLDDLFSFAEIESHILNVRFSNPERYYCKSDRLGLVMRELLKLLEKETPAGEIKEQHFLLESLVCEYNKERHGHATHLCLRVKKEDDTIYEVKLYNPNVTYNHVRFQTENVGHVRRLTYRHLGLGFYGLHNLSIDPVTDEWFVKEYPKENSKQNAYDFIYQADQKSYVKTLVHELDSDENMKAIFHKLAEQGQIEYTEIP